MLVVGGIDIGNRLDVSQIIINAINTFPVIIVENISNFNKICQDLRIDPSAELIEYYHPMSHDEEIDSMGRISRHLNTGVDVLILSGGRMLASPDPVDRIIDLAHDLGHQVSVIPGPLSI